VKPAPFAYHRPRTGDEVDERLAEHGSEAKVLAGGQSLVPLLNMRLATPSHLIDINRLEGEPGEPAVREAVVAFGSLVRHGSVERSAEVAARLPLLVEAIEYVGHPAIRSRGTVVGSIAHADPSAELPAVLNVLEGEASVRSRRGRRSVKAVDFLVGPFRTVLDEDEWVDEVRFPIPARPHGTAFEEFARRSGDYALCGVACVAERADDGRVEASLSYLGMGPVPVRLVMPTLGPDEMADGALAEALEDATRSQLEPIDDLHASGEYRMWLAKRLGLRAARRAAASIPALHR